MVSIQIQQFYKYMLGGWQAEKRPWWKRLWLKITNKYEFTLIGPIVKSEINAGAWRYKITFRLPITNHISHAEHGFTHVHTPEPLAPLIVCDVDGTPRTIDWYFTKTERRCM